MLVLAGAVAPYLALAVLVACNKLPWCDEGWYGGPAINLITHGSMGTPNFVAGWLPGVGRYTYWEMPGFILALAAWFKLFGAGILTARALPLACGAAVLVVWDAILRRLGIGLRVRALALLLIGLDYFFILDATYARADMMSLLLLSIAIAEYLAWRERPSSWRLLLTSTAVIAAGLTHPNAGLLAVMAIGLLAVADRRLLGPSRVWVCVIPLIVGAVLWGLYIREAPDLFLAQFSKNATGRFSPVLHPWSAIEAEVVGRYLKAFGLGPHSTGTPRLVALKGIVLVAWVVGAVGTRVDRSLWHERGPRTLLGILAVFVVYYTFFEGSRTTYYLVWLVPFFSSILAVWAVRQWARGGLRRYGTVGLVAAVLLVQAGASVMKARQQWGMRSFYQVADYLRSHAAGPPAIASIEFGYALGFAPDAFIDDVSLGSWSHIKPDYVVLDERYREYLPDPGPDPSPEMAAAGELLRTRCTPVFEPAFYTVYRCQ
jgi:4-amino-4-deoxy-L-arabinose transferase-like glycosyltransferase